MAAGRNGQGQAAPAGKAGNSKRRGNSAASAGPGGMVGNMPPGMIGNYGGGCEDGAGGVYADDLQAQGKGAIPVHASVRMSSHITGAACVLRT